jgi:hypothetical protein
MSSNPRPTKKIKNKENTHQPIFALWLALKEALDQKLSSQNGLSLITVNFSKRNYVFLEAFGTSL